MATCVISESPKINAELYEQVLQKVQQSGDFPPAGWIFQVVGQGDIWRVISLWQSRDDFERFAAERLAPAWSELGISRDDVNLTFFEAHSYMAGDLSGAMQPGMAMSSRSS
jgi:hypothetical protein